MSQKMNIHTNKQKQYLEEVIKLHYEKGYGEYRISRILPIGHSTVSRWLRIFAAENVDKSVQMSRTKSKPQTQPQPTPSWSSSVNEIKELQAEVVRLEAELKQARLRADAYDAMNNVAEAKFNIVIRKKAGAKQ
jgi:transposase